MFGIKIMSLKKFNEMELDTRKLKNDLDEKNKKIAELEHSINGDTVCDRYCEQCKHGIETSEDYLWNGCGGFQSRKKYVCKLSIPCKSFVQK